ncbi:RNA polymerase sigma factor [Chitiniphilus purpureus]|uniref:RNA polymerase sigma factor n=1 Tax=Chitiniphilus purpureus TaxID=2981137 RepID=A0ABY6DK42_9NEIS|nr:RNA polymerase sigma factor [Chitiniphilus sp. CD1]UXY14697.1 RNA polymerase sigma factor [Chitiniphilus sp. CD1]
MTDPVWIASTLAAARPRALAALLRYLRSMEMAEDAFQEACLRALQRWPADGAPRDPLAWLILVGRNAALDQLRREARHAPLPPEGLQLEAEQPDHAEQLDQACYRDDLLRLLFVACHPVLPPAQRIALALRVVCGLTVREIASAFLVAERAMAQRITRAKRRITVEGIPFDTPDAAARQARLAAVSGTLYLMFNEGYAASGGAQMVRAALCDEAIRLMRLLGELFPDDGEVSGLTALMLLQHARRAARLDAGGDVVLLEDQDRRRWDHAAIAEGCALLCQARAHGRPGPYRLQAEIAAAHACAARADQTDWAAIDALYAVLEAIQPSPVVTLNRAVALEKTQGPAAALASITPLGERLAGYFHFHGVRGALLLRLGRHAAAHEAFGTALALARTPAEARHIRRQIDYLDAGLNPPVENRGPT